MAIEFPDGRRMHIARICGVNKNDEPVPDIWVDVLRIDKMKIRTQDSVRIFSLTYDHQDVTLKLKWNDDKGHDGYTEENKDDEPRSRDVVIVKVCSPDEKDTEPEDLDEWVPIPAIKKVHLRQGPAAVNRHFFDAVLRDKNREEVQIRKFYHYDTNFDSDADIAFNEGDTVFVMPVDEYEMDEDSKDEEQYLEHEIVMESNLKVTPHWQESPAGNDTKSTFKFKNQFLIDASDEAEDSEEGEINPPWRLDPFQNIINCKFGEPPLQWLAGIDIEGHLAGGAGRGDCFSAEGETYGLNVQGATGRGFTVFVDGCIAYGKITMPDGVKRGVFMKSSIAEGAPEVELGIIEKGEIVWETVFTAPGSTYNLEAISYANERFFVAYNHDESCLAVTTDGYEFITTNTDIGSSNVAYRELDPKNKTGIYVMIATWQVTDDAEPRANFSNSLAWATSSDGLSWSTSYNESVTSGPGGGRGSFTEIAYGNGVFVACSSTKHVFENYLAPGDESPPSYYTLAKSAVAISDDGESWSTIELPNGIVDGGPENHFSGDTGSECAVVAFIRDKGLGTGRPTNETGGSGTLSPDEPTGFFVACDYIGTSDLNGTTSSNLYVSVDGYSWSVVRSDSGSVYPGSAEGYLAVTGIAKDMSKTKIRFA